MLRESFQSSLDGLQKDLLRMGALVEEMIHLAVKSLRDQDVELARNVINDDQNVDQMELDIEQRCFRLLATQQPMAVDLRIISTALKIITDLERMADHATDIARTTIRLQGQPLIKPLVDIPRMAEIAQSMVRESLSAYINRDVNLAYSMIERDDEIDSLHGQIFRELLLFMMEDPRTINQATQLLMVSHSLERLADHATNIGEWVIYMVTGERKELND